jgi:quercetin dioxygenase-like cupin family protein
MAEAAVRQVVKRTMLQKSDVPGGKYEALIGLSETIPNGCISRETHPGLEEGYVLEGSATLLVEGQPPLSLKSGQSWKLAPSAVHEFRAGPEGVKVLATWVVEKGKPFASSAG